MRNQTGFTLAEVLIFIFEKAINVHYQELLNKIQKQNIHNFFFIESKLNPFYYDFKLTNYWLNLSLEKRIQHLDKIDYMIEEIIRSESNQMLGNKIQEQEEEEFEDLDDFDDTYSPRSNQQFLQLMLDQEVLRNPYTSSELFKSTNNKLCHTRIKMLKGKT